MQCNSISSSKPTSNPLQLLFIHMVNVRPIRLTRFHTTTSPGYWGPLSETTAQEFHPVAQCDQWPLLFHAVQQHILFQTHIKPSATFVHSHGQCATHQINEIPYNNVTRVLRAPQWNHSTRVSSRRTVWSMTVLLFHAVQQHILFQTHIKPSATFVHSHGQCATHQINEIPYNNVTRVLRAPQWNHSTRVSSRRTVWSMTPVVPCSATAYPLPNPHQTLCNFCSFTWSMCDPSD